MTAGVRGVVDEPSEARGLTERAAPREAPSAGPIGHSEPRGHGHRLLEAIEAFESFPALARARDRLLSLLDADAPTADIVPVIESDSALTIGLLRLANGPGGAHSGVPSALEGVDAGDLRRLAAAMPTFELMGDGAGWGKVARQFRLHAVATVGAAERLIADGHAKHPDRLRVAALLHDIGKLVLLRAYGRFGRGFDGTPADRLGEEQQGWGLDHAVVGGVLARRLGLPRRVATLIERHHSDDADGDIALLTLADALAHYGAGHPVDGKELVRAAARAGVSDDALDVMLHELPGGATAGTAPRRIEPSPLSKQETASIALMATGRRVKDIACELGISPSTVRTHLFNAYSKLGVADRTQAVLLATKRGWI